ncbi:MAG: hypothetical protein HYW90_01790 [Candidatus Sungbacteria bacterium]|nr:hypothetical protein [Candidatus Sungbacteria bacterium]
MEPRPIDFLLLGGILWFLKALLVLVAVVLVYGLVDAARDAYRHKKTQENSRLWKRPYRHLR